MRTHTITSVFLLLLLPFTNLMAQYPIPDDNVRRISLKIDLKPNSTYRYIAKDKRNIVQEMMGISIEIKQETTLVYQFKIKSNTNEGIDVEVFFEEIGLNFELPQGKTSLDLKNTNPSEFSHVLNKPFDISLTPQGKVVEMEGLEDIFRNQSGTDSAILEEFFTKKKVTAFIESSFNIFPTDSISMGDSWDVIHNHSLNNQFDLFFDKTFSLDGLSEDMAWLTVENKIKSSASETLSFVADSNDTKQEGIIEIDRNSGLILFSDVKNEFQGMLKSNNMEVPVKILFENSLKGEKL